MVNPTAALTVTGTATSGSTALTHSATLKVMVQFESDGAVRLFQGRRGRRSGNLVEQVFVSLLLEPLDEPPLGLRLPPAPHSLTGDGKAIVRIDLAWVHADSLLQHADGLAVSSFVGVNSPQVDIGNADSGV